MIVDLIFIVAALAVIIAIYKLKFSKENIAQKIQQETRNSEVG